MVPWPVTDQRSDGAKHLGGERWQRQRDQAARQRSPDGNFHGFLRSEGEFTTIDFPGDIRTEANGITAEDDVVGTHADGSATLHGFRLSEGTLTRIDFPGATFTRGLGINSEG